MKTDTLSFRLFFFTSLWMVISLAIVAVLVSRDYRHTVEKQFEELVTANMYNLMGSVSKTADGKLTGAPRLGDTRFQQFNSGWYWTVTSVADSTVILSSKSLSDQKLPSRSSVKYDTNFQRAYRIRDSAGNNLMAVEAQVFIGEGDELYAFRSTGNLAVLNKSISEFRQRLIILLGIFGIGLIVTSFAIVRFGLKPIRQATSQLAQIRDGKAKRIEGSFPQEILPLIDETNALIKSNRAIVERSRTQVGNLAHSLKTPLSVMALEVTSLPKPVAKIVTTQLNAMNEQVQTYLNRAMISARHGAITSRTDIIAPLSRLVRTFNKLFQKINFELKIASDFDLEFAGEQQDFEEVIGNLLENAGNCAKANVIISLGKANGESEPRIHLKIIDDGPGLTRDEIVYVLKRGNRLDENRPGTGLGLSIVSDIINEYGGTIDFTSGEEGGLQVAILLPATIGKTRE